MKEYTFNLLNEGKKVKIKVKSGGLGLTLNDADSKYKEKLDNGE